MVNVNGIHSVGIGTNINIDRPYSFIVGSNPNTTKHNLQSEKAGCIFAVGYGESFNYNEYSQSKSAIKAHEDGNVFIADTYNPSSSIEQQRTIHLQGKIKEFDSIVLDLTNEVYLRKNYEFGTFYNGLTLADTYDVDIPIDTIPAFVKLDGSLVFDNSYYDGISSNISPNCNILLPSLGISYSYSSDMGITNTKTVLYKLKIQEQSGIDCIVGIRLVLSEYDTKIVKIGLYLYICGDGGGTSLENEFKKV